MSNTDRYARLFEPVAIGPLTARNRFYQVPHCCGLGHLRPQAHAAMREMKAEGGWAVVSTEETEIHPTSDISPYAEQRIWDERDIPALRLMTDAVHAKGALAAIELAHNGNHAGNLFSRTPPLGVTDMQVDIGYPKQARRILKKEIKAFRQWHRDAALRAKQAGFDVIYVYAGHRMTLTHQFLLSDMNTRIDEYGGSLENRARLLRELLSDTREAVGDTCAVAFRFAVDEMKGPEGMQASEEGRAVVEMMAELPDLWDVNVSEWDNDSLTTRFEPEDGYQVKYMEFVKSVTTKPVVGVGRLSSPDMMLSLVNRGVMDFIGSARPSIADPFLPNKIQNGEIESIRECIGCNICVSCDNIGIPIRCTQNPTMGEEWRQGWHPESIPNKKSDKRVLVIGAGAAGLECTMQLAKRGYEVFLSEKTNTAGGRCLRESTLKGLSAWRRVVDHRVHEISQQANAKMFWESDLNPDEIIELECDDVIVATGCHWRNDGVGQHQGLGIPGLDGLNVCTPDDVMDGIDSLSGHTVIYDQEQGYLGGAIADHLATTGSKLSIVTPGSVVSAWTAYSLEQARVQKSLIEQNVNIIANKHIIKADKGSVTLCCVFTDQTETLLCDNLVLLTQRQSNMDLYKQLTSLTEVGDKANLPRVHIIGDAEAPALIVDAVYSGHKMARQIDMDAADIEAILYLREIPSLTS
ncbi:MAG: FAD-dependent oxidoreductase [Granulosicoccaceae bacterium]